MNREMARWVCHGLPTAVGASSRGLVGVSRGCRLALMGSLGAVGRLAGVGGDGADSTLKAWEALAAAAAWLSLLLRLVGFAG